MPLDEVSDKPEVVLADAGYCNEADLVAPARHRWLWHWAGRARPGWRSTRTPCGDASHG